MNLRIQHSSMQAQDLERLKAEDANTVFRYARKVGNILCSGTEGGAPAFGRALEGAARDHGYYCYVHPSGEWVAFDLRWGRHVDHGWVGPIVPGNSRHAARGIAWLTARAKDRDAIQVSIGSLHFLTADEPDAAKNSDLTRAAVGWAKKHGPLVFVNADTNRDDQTRNVWASNGLETCWDELDRWPDTHEGGRDATIDVISRLRSGPMTFTDARVLGDRALDLNADHKLIQATVKVQA